MINTIFAYICTILGAATLSWWIMRVIDRLDNPRKYHRGH